jgi:hypothetical protein
MQRSVGVTLSAVFVFFGCALALFAGAAMLLAFRMAPNTALAAPFVRAAILFDVILDLGFVGWGVASAVGLLQLREWARISMVVFSAIMIFFCLIPMAIMPFVPIPQSDAVPANLTLLIRTFIIVFYGIFVALGIFWIYFFNKRSVKAQFKSVAAPAAGALADATVQGKRPVPILILAWLFIIGGCFTPLVLLMGTPVVIFGHFVQSRWGALYYVIVGLLSVVIGIGLLKLRPWSWIAAICVQLVSFFNGLALFVVPGAWARFENYLVSQQASMGFTPQQQTLSPVFAGWIGLVFSLLFILAVLTVLAIYKSAFKAEPASPAAAT